MAHRPAVFRAVAKPTGPCPICGGDAYWRDPDTGKVRDKFRLMYYLSCDRAGIDDMVKPGKLLPKDQPPRRGPDRKPRERRTCGPYRKSDLGERTDETRRSAVSVASDTRDLPTEAKSPT
jgi:hypothetical protein